MRESIGGAWILGIVMTFIVLFASFLAVSINYSKAFKVKNNVVDLIEKNEGMNEHAAEEIYGYLKSQGYILKGECKQPKDEDDDGKLDANKFVGFDGTTIVSESSPALYCVQENKPKNEDTALEKSYYSVQIFFRLDLPVLGDIFTFSVTGETMSIYFADNGIFQTKFDAAKA